MRLLDIWRRWLNTPQHMTVAALRAACAEVGVEFSGQFAALEPDPMPEMVARMEALQTKTFGGRACPEQLPHGHGEGRLPFTDACPSCGAAL